MSIDKQDNIFSTAIIPARGGSIRIPRKNIYQIAGLPLVAHTILQAKKSKSINEVYVTTDDVEIAGVSEKYGAKVIMRPDDISNEKATSESALIHALDYRLMDGLSDPENIIFLQCTSPIRADDDIDSAMSLFFETEADSLFSVCKNRNFIWQYENESVVPINYNYTQRPREQDMEPQYCENGSIYITKTSILRDFNNRLGGKIVMYEMDYWSSFQVDVYEDIQLIEWIMQKAKV